MSGRNRLDARLGSLGQGGRSILQLSYRLRGPSDAPTFLERYYYFTTRSPLPTPARRRSCWCSFCLRPFFALFGPVGFGWHCLFAWRTSTTFVSDQPSLHFLLSPGPPRLRQQPPAPSPPPRRVSRDAQSRISLLNARVTGVAPSASWLDTSSCSPSAVTTASKRSQSASGPVEQLKTPHSFLGQPILPYTHFVAVALVSSPRCHR